MDVAWRTRGSNWKMMRYIVRFYFQQRASRVLLKIFFECKEDKLQFTKPLSLFSLVVCCTFFSLCSFIYYHYYYLKFISFFFFFAFKFIRLAEWLDLATNKIQTVRDQLPFDSNAGVCWLCSFFSSLL